MGLKDIVQICLNDYFQYGKETFNEQFNENDLVDCRLAVEHFKGSSPNFASNIKRI